MRIQRNRRATFVPLATLVVALSLIGCGGGEGSEGAASGGTSGGAVASGASGAGTTAEGERLYGQRCASCHQANGQGTPGVYPPLAGSEYATSANAGVPIRIVIHGIQGPITVKGQPFNSLMPAYGLGIVMSDAEVASVLTYVRASWGNAASAVSAADVASVREETKGHAGAVTAELLKPLMN